MYYDTCLYEHIRGDKIQRCNVQIVQLKSSTTLEAKHAGRGAQSGPLGQRQGLTEHSSRQRL